MTPAMKQDNRTIFSETSAPQLPVTFTGNAIQHLASIKAPVDMNEWVWHTEIVDGKKYCVVTDRIHK